MTLQSHGDEANVDSADLTAVEGLPANDTKFTPKEYQCPADESVRRTLCSFHFNELDGSWVSELAVRRNDTSEYEYLVIPSPPLKILDYTNSVAVADFKPGSSTAVAVGGTSMEYGYLVKNAKCLPTSYYNWGFSSLLLFTFLLASLVYLVVLQIMALKLYEHSRSDRLRHPINVYQDAIDIARELSDHYGRHVDDIDCARMTTKLQLEHATMILDLDGLPNSRHAERELDRRNDGRWLLNIGSDCYRRFVKILNSRWAEEEAMSYATQRSAVPQSKLVDDEQRILVAGAASMTARSDPADDETEAESIALEPLRSRESGEIDSRVPSPVSS